MIRIVVVDDHAIVRAGVVRLLAAERDMEVVAESGSGRGGVRLVAERRPDVVLLDFGLPDVDGLEATSEIAALKTGARVLVLTMHQSEEYAIRLIRAGAKGFVVKGASPEELLQAVRRVAAGGVYVSAAVQERVIGRLGEDDPAAVPESRLSNREMQVLLQLAAGQTSRETAERLCLSLSTVETYRSRVLDKLGCRNNSDLTRFAIRRGLIGLE